MNPLVDIDSAPIKNLFVHDENKTKSLGDHSCTVVLIVNIYMQLYL